MLLVFVAALAAFAQDSDDDDPALDLSRGTYQLGGWATANIALVTDEPDVYLLISPNGGIFVADRTLVHIGLDMLVDEVEGFDASVFAGVDYFLPGDWVAPYVGIGVGYGTRQLDDAPSPYTFDFANVLTGTGRLGLVLPVSDSVGIDLGAEVNYNVAFQQEEDGGTETWVTIPMGYTGVRAFFR